MASGNWQRKMMEWLQGRQGPDDLAVFSMNLAIVVVVVNLFARVSWLGWVALVLIAYSMFRIQSKNLGSRARENEAFLKALGPARPWVQNPRAAWTPAGAVRPRKTDGRGLPPCVFPNNVPYFMRICKISRICPAKKPGQLYGSRKSAGTG